MHKLQPSFRTGQHVDVRGEPWQVVHAERFDEVTLVTLRGLGIDNLNEAARVLTPFDHVRTVEPRTGLAGRSRRRVIEKVVAVVAESPQWRDCWTAASAKIDLRPWQLQPALAAIGGASRILLADEVGLGKTIQALLIVAELSARGFARRVLVLTPASLREQWAVEMSERFGWEASIFDQTSLAAMTASLPVGVNPWNTAPLIVSSIDLVKRPEVRVALDAVPLDVLVVDEAHHLTPGSDRGAVVADLAARTLSVVLVTATPHSGDDAAYRFLRGLGDVDGSDDLVVYRRTSHGVNASGRRRVHLLAVAPTEAEHALLQSTLEYAKAVWGGPGTSRGARLVASVIARRASSSPEAARQTLERRLALLRGNVPPDRQAALPWEEDDCDDANASDTLLAVSGLTDRGSEVAWLERLVQLAQLAANTPSKIEVIRKLLRRTTEHVIVFSEYRDVVELVRSRLADLTTVAALHGGLSPAARRYVIRQFNDGRVRTLVATDAAGEGLNLQSRCRLVVNLELPWNPLRLEQRVGRVDRLGQTRRVHAIHLFHRGSFEDRVLARLERRRARARVDLCRSGAVSEDAIVAAIFEDRPLDAGQAPRLVQTTEPASESTARAETQRRLRLIAGGARRLRPAEGPIYAARAQRRDPVRMIVVLFAADLVDRDGRLVQRELVPLRIEAEPRARLPRRLSKRLVRLLAEEPRLRAQLGTQIATRLAVAQKRVAPSAAAFEHRAGAILSALERRQGRLFQGSLFDRRKEQQSHARQTAIATWQQYLAHRVVVSRALATLTPTAPRLVGAWLAD